MPYAFDGERAPLISMRLYGRVSGDELELMLADLATLIKREQAFTVVLDCAELDALERAQLRRYAGWVGSNFEALARHQRGLAVAANNTGRVAMASLMQLQRMPMPVQVVGTLDRARQWAQTKLHGGTIIARVHESTASNPIPRKR